MAFFRLRGEFKLIEKNGGRDVGDNIRKFHLVLRRCLVEMTSGRVEKKGS